MAKAYLVILDDNDFELYSTKAKAQKALGQAFRQALKADGVTADAKREARKYWKVDKTSFMVDVEDVGIIHTIRGYMLERVIH